MGAAALEFHDQDISVERAHKDLCEHDADIPEFVKAARKSIDKGFNVIGERLERQIESRRTLLTMVR